MKYFFVAVRTYLLVSRKRWIRLIDGGGSYCSSQATRVGEQSHLLQNFAKTYAQIRGNNHICSKMLPNIMHKSKWGTITFAQKCCQKLWNSTRAGFCHKLCWKLFDIFTWFSQDIWHCDFKSRWEVGFPKLGSDILAADSSLYITAHPLEAKFMAIVKSVKVSKVSK